MSETAIQTEVRDEKPIIMKSGIVHWVKPATWDRISEVLATQAGHQFMRISELGITVNTAEIDGAYTREQYHDYSMVKQGMWQCEYGNWHNKGKHECQCHQEALKAKKAAEEAKRREEENKPLTEQEREANQARMLRMKEEGALKDLQAGREHGVFASMYRNGNRAKNRLRRSTITAFVEKHGDVKLKGIAINENA